MLELQNLTKEKINTNSLELLAERVLKREKPRRTGLSVVLVSSPKMQQLNKTYRGKDKTTNVLAFSGGKEALGEIVLCPSAIRKDALEYKISFQRAILWMFVHGLLHLLGYDHKSAKDERIMTQKEQRYLS